MSYYLYYTGKLIPRHGKANDIILRRYRSVGLRVGPYNSGEFCFFRDAEDNTYSFSYYLIWITKEDDAIIASLKGAILHKLEDNADNYEFIAPNVTGRWNTIINYVNIPIGLINLV